MSPTYQRIYSVVKRIPKGSVATYGQIAALTGNVNARQVGYALHALPKGYTVPWHRVINAKGEISIRSCSDGHDVQRLFLETEGVQFDARGRIPLQQYRWQP